MAKGTCRFHLSLFFFCSLVFSEAADTLIQGETLRDGESLISLNQVFELGFFSPTAATSSSARYLGIWYHGIPETAVIWIANRNQPLSGNGTLAFSGVGNLLISSAAAEAIQLTNTTSTAGNFSLRLSNDGNLVLSSSPWEEVIWQSFDLPTDTFLPGMKLTVDLSARRSRLLRSWRNARDPGDGNFSLGLDPRGSAQVLIWNGETPHWRSGQWYGRSFIGIRIRPLGINGFNLLRNQKRMELTFSEYNGSIFRFVIKPDGVLNVSQMVVGSKKWTTAFALPGNDCERYNFCGDNARCVISSGGAATCECLTGYHATAEGCVRRRELGCTSGGGERDGFAVMRGMNLPDFSRWESGERCEEACSSNCSCVAYAHVTELGCLLWDAPLVDLHQIAAGGGYDLYLKLAASDLPARARSWTWAVILGVFLLAAVAFGFALYFWWTRRPSIQGWWKKKVKREKIKEERAESVMPSSVLFAEDGTDGKSAELPVFTFDAIVIATANFSDSNKLGEGGFGLVYKATLPDGREAAVKRLSEKSGQGIEEFKNEVKLIAELQHRNLVRLVGCCVEADEKILVYEYLPNKSLDAFIFSPEMAARLDWRKRLEIMEGIARGLLYLHRDSRLRIIHRDLKASNILLDEGMSPKISDFGMARIFGGDQNQANTNRVVGTLSVPFFIFLFFFDNLDGRTLFSSSSSSSSSRISTTTVHYPLSPSLSNKFSLCSGYMSPEYAMEGVFSTKSDVYSFGVLMLEIISGQKNNAFRSDGSPNLVGRAWQLWNEDKSTELLDPAIRDSASIREVTRCVQMGLLCVQDRARDRPNMSSVVFMLGSDAIIQPVPRAPTFTVDGSSGETDSALHEYYAFSSSRDITVSVVTGR